MRRQDKEITDPKAIEDIILNSKVCKLAMSDGDMPYVVPVCFGMKDNTIYIHSATEGKKIDILKKNPKVCFVFEIYNQVIKSAKACMWGVKYKSVIGFGNASLVTDEGLKMEAFDSIMNQYGEGDFAYDKGLLAATVIIKIDIESMTGKQSDI